MSKETEIVTEEIRDLRLALDEAKLVLDTIHALAAAALPRGCRVQIAINGEWRAGDVVGVWAAAVLIALPDGTSVMAPVQLVKRIK